jgi:hypothetical protein
MTLGGLQAHDFSGRDDKVGAASIGSRRRRWPVSGAYRWAAAVLGSANT